MEVEGGAGVAGPEGVAAATVLGRCPLDLFDGVHGEPARTFEPKFVSGALEQLQKGVSVAGGAVAEVGALLEGACLPRQLAAGYEQLRQLFVVRGE